MKFTLSDISVFTDIFDIYKNYSDTIKIDISNEGLHLQSSDNANVSIIDIKLNYTFFDTYECVDKFIIDFNLNDICKILKICKKSKSLTYFILDDTICKITTSSNNIKKTFKINSIYSTTHTLLDINQLYIRTIFEMDSELLKSIFDDFILFSDEITIQFDNSKLHFSTNNDNIDTSYYYDTNTDIDETDKYTSTFVLDYLHKFKLIKHFEKCNIKCMENTPIFLSSPINRDWQFTFILAPII